MADGGSDHCTAGLTGKLKLAMQGAYDQADLRTIAVSVSVSLQGASHRELASGGMWLSRPCSSAFLCLCGPDFASDGEIQACNGDL